MDNTIQFNNRIKMNVQEDTTNAGINPDTKSKTPTNTNRNGVTKKRKTKAYWANMIIQLQAAKDLKKIEEENKKEQKEQKRTKK